MNSFVFEKHVPVYFGEGVVGAHLQNLLSKYGKNILLAYGGGSIKNNGIYNEMMEILNKAGKVVVEFPGIMSNPTYQKVQEGAELVREKNIDLILAVGGGSVLDCCKVVSAQGKSDQDLWQLQFAENRLPEKFVPLGVVITAAGTGSEMNAYSVITHEEKKIKQTMIGAWADFAFLDPAYTLTLPLGQVMAGAFDTLSHCMETYFGKPDENNLSDEMNEAVMKSVVFHMRKTKEDPFDLVARSELMWASSMAENSILKIGKVMAFQTHHIEHQLGAYTDCGHGQGLAVLQPVFYRKVFEEGVDRFAGFAEKVWGIAPGGMTKKELALQGIEALAAFVKEVGLPARLREIGISKDTDFRSVADTCKIVEGGCFRTISRDEVYDMLLECY